MSAMCELLPWDSEFFGFPVARVRDGTMDRTASCAILKWCSDAGVRLLYFLANDVPSWVVATGAGFELVDIRVEMVLDRCMPLTGRVVSPGVVLREAIQEDLPRLLPIAASAHSDSRFFVDKKVPPNRARELFQSWLRRSVEGALADVVFVAELDGRTVAYITGTLKERVGNVGLVGVGKSARGRGIGLAMVQKALEWFAYNEALEVTVVTQGRNVAAQRLYQRCGFVTQSTRLWFHRWFG